MNLDDQKSLALKQCIDIYHDYEESEVEKFAPKSVQLAWKIGKEYFDAERKASAKAMENFTL